MIPGIGVYYNSTCAQCDAGCNVMGKVREGRVLKLEGNPVSAINRGRMCGLGQAGVQHHYNPDRVREPLLRNGDKGEAITWGKAYALIAEKLKGVKGKRSLLSGGVSGHLKVLLGNYLDSIGCKNHFVYEALAPGVVRAANKKPMAWKCRATTSIKPGWCCPLAPTSSVHGYRRCIFATVCAVP